MTSTPFVPLRSASDAKERLISRLPGSALDTLRAYSLMIEERETEAGRPPRRRRGNDTGPEPATMDYVLTIAIAKGLAADRAYIAWRRDRDTRAARNGTPTANHSAEPTPSS